MAGMAAFFYVLMLSAQLHVHFTPDQSVQIIKDFNEGKHYEYKVQKAMIGEAWTSELHK